MRNRVIKVLVVMTILLIAIASIHKVFAGQVVDVTVNPGSYGKNKDGQVETTPLTVTVKYPGRDAGNSVVTVKYQNGESEYAGSTFNPNINENGTVSFTPKSAGQATITITGAVGYNNNGDPNSKVSYDNETKVVTVKDTSYVAPPPEPPKPPANNNTTNTTNTIANNTTNNTTNNTVKPEIKNPDFKKVDETVYAVKNCNVRSSCSTEVNDNKIGGLMAGQEVKRTGVGGNWSRIIYNGKEAYVYSSLLSTEPPVEEEPENEVEDNFKNELDLLKEDIGVLPEVGTNIATVSFVGIAIFALAAVLIVKYRINKNEIDD